MNITFTKNVRTETELILSTVNYANSFPDVGTVIVSDSSN